MTSPSTTALTDALVVRGRRATALPPDERRRLIVAATLPLLLEHGLAITTRQIAEAAGVAEGTIFRAFADKEALIDAVVEAALDTAPLEARLAEIDPALPLDDRLTAAVRLLQERAVRVWQLVSTVGYMRRPGGRRSALDDLGSLVALFEPDRDRLRDDPRANARRLRALSIAGAHPALMGDEPLAPTEVVALFLDGTRRRPVPPDRARATRRSPRP